MGRTEYYQRLQSAKAASSWSFKRLGTAINRPSSTVHGWIGGRHLPYPRDNEDFEAMLRLLGVEEQERAEFMATLVLLRSHRQGPSNPYRGLQPFTSADHPRFFGRDDVTERLVDAVTYRQRTEPSPASTPLILIGQSGAGKSSVLQAGLQARLLHSGTNVIYRSAVERSDVWIDELGAGPTVIIVDQFEHLLRSERRDDLDRVVDALANHQQRDGNAVVIGLRSDGFEAASTNSFLMSGLQRGPFVLDQMAPEQRVRCIIGPAEQAGFSVESALLSQLLLDLQLHLDDPVASSPLPLLSHLLFTLVDHCESTTIDLADYEAIGGLEKALEQSAEEAFQQLDEADARAARLLFAQLVTMSNEGSPARCVTTRSRLSATNPDVDFDTALEAFTERRLLTADHNNIVMSHEALMTAWPRLAAWIDEADESLRFVRRIGNARAVWEESGHDSSMLLGGATLEAALAAVADPLVEQSLGEPDRQFVKESEAVQLAFATSLAHSRSRQLAAQSSLVAQTERAISARLAVAAFETAPTVEATSALISATSPALGPRFEGSAGPTALSSYSSRRYGPGLVQSDAGRRTLTIFASVADATGRSAIQRVATIPTDPEHVVLSIATDPETDQFLVGGTDGYVAVVEPETSVASPLRHPDGQGDINSVRLFDGGRSAVAAIDTGVAGWRRDESGEWQEGPDVKTISGAMAVAVARDARLGAVACRNGVVSTWQLDRPEEVLWSSDERRENPASAIAINDDGSMLVAGYHDGTLRAWDITEPTQPIEHRIESGHGGTWVNAIALSADGTMAASAGSDGTVRFWSTSDWRSPRHQLHHPTVVLGVVFTTAIHPNGIATSSEDGILRTWGDHGAETESLPPTWSVTAATEDPEAGLVSISRDGALRWTVSTQGELNPSPLFKPDRDEQETLVGSGGLSPSGRRLCLGTRGGWVWVLDVGSSQITHRLRVGSDHHVTDYALIEFAVMASDEFVFATSRQGVCQGWGLDLDGPGSVRDLGEINLPAPALGAAVDLQSGQVFVAAANGTIGHLSLDEANDTLRLIGQVQHGVADALCITSHPRRSVVASGHGDRTVVLWEFGIDDLIRRTAVLNGPAGNVMTVRFSPDGDRLAAGSTDGTIWVWNLCPEPALSVVIDTKTDGVYSLAFLDGNLLVSVGASRTAHAWDLDTGRAVGDIVRRLGDPVDPGTWHHYAPDTTAPGNSDLPVTAFSVT